MDGFDLARNVRADPRWAGLPIIMITSRIAQKHGEHAAQLGVNHYLGKPYSEDDLIGLVGQYAAGRPSRADAEADDTLLLPKHGPRNEPVLIAGCRLARAFTLTFQASA